MQTITKEIKTRFVTISPADAREIWEDQQRRVASGKCKQRVFRASVSEKYANDMRSGAWAETHQGIAFDVDGNLLDGQHRIHAIILAGTPVRIMVTTGLPKRSGRIETMDAMDGGRLRSNGDKLHLHGVSNANLAAAATLCIAQGSQGSSKIRTLSYTQLSDIFHIYGNQIHDALQILRCRKVLIKAHIVGPIAFAISGCGDIGFEVATKLATLEGLTPRSPISALNKAIEDGRIVDGANSSRYVTSFRLFASCFFAIKSGTPVSRLMPNQEAWEWFMQTQTANVKKITHITNGYK